MGFEALASRLPVEGLVPEVLDRELSVIGKSLDRKDGIEKVTGHAKYSSDLNFPGMLHAKILRSPHAHARITRIDTSRAEALPGVHAVLSRNNCQGWLTQWYMIPQPAFPDEVGYVGQEVAVVAAEDIETARRAVELIEVDYEVLSAVLDVEAALRPDAPLVPTLNVMQGREGNAQTGPFVSSRGDVEEGLRQAEVIVDGTYQLSTQFHVDIQTRCCVANYDGDTLVVYESSQGVWNVKLQLAKSLGIPEDKVRVVVQYMGGGFGSKAGAQRVVHYTAKLALMAKRPVKLELTRAEEFVSHPRRYGATVKLRLGARRDGALTAISCHTTLDLGCGTMFSGDEYVIMHQISELYRCPNMRVEVGGVYTHTPPTGPQRGVWDPIAAFGMESVMDDLAVKLDMDPIALRFKNYAHYADEANKIPYSSKYLDRCMEAVAKGIGWERRAELAERNRRSTKKRGLGFACYCLDRAGFLPFNARAEVIARRDGRFELRAGVVEIGAGQITVLSMIAAEELGVGLDDVSVVWGDTKGTFYAPSSHASRITVEMGPATLQAAALVRQQLFEIVAPHLGVDASDLRSVNGRIYAKTDPDRSISMKEACALMPEEAIRAVGSRAPNPESPVLRLFGAQAAEVEVDVESGELKVLRIVAAHDIGRALNPKFVESQQFGAAVMGLGYALYEEPEIDRKTGILLNPDVHQYRVPTSLETPDIQGICVEGYDPYYPYSAKPVGEAGLPGIMPAIRNAVYHATGLRINRVPITTAGILAQPSDKDGPHAV